MVKSLLKIELVIVAWAVFGLVWCFLMLNLIGPQTKYAPLPLHFMKMYYPPAANISWRKQRFSSLKQYIPPWNCSGCFHWSYNLTINQEDICKSYEGKNNKNQTIDLIFLIPATYSGRAQRDAIRGTWASVTRNNTSNFRHVFFFGASKDPNRMRQLAEESRQYRDVVVNSGFDDTYRNLTMKTMTLLRWLAENCPRARFFLKVNDDTWVNSHVLLTSLGRVGEQLQTAIAGRCTMSWGVSYSEHPADRYPAYCSGTAYAGTVNVARQLVLVSRDVPFFRLEDVFVGLCLKQLGYAPKNLEGFHIVMPTFFHRDPCEAWKDRVSTLPRILPADLQKYWKLAAQCGNVEEKRLKFEKKRQVNAGDRTHNDTKAPVIAKQHSSFSNNETKPHLKMSSSVNRTVKSGSALKQFIPPWNCSGCFHWRYNLVINQEDVCKSYDSKTNKNQTIDLIFLIPSTHEGRAQRDAIRSTWASVTRNNTSNFRHVFFFGASKDPNRMRQLAEESRQYRDVVVNSGFDDTFRNLTLKTMTLLRWFAETCPRARFFLKVNDDMWVNSRVLLTSLGRVEKQLQTAIAGKCPMPRHIFRNLHHEWGVSYSEYPAHIYPVYCSGTAYAGTVSVARQLVLVSRDVPFFRLEDVFVGLCLKQLGYAPKNLEGFHIVMPTSFYGDLCDVLTDKVISLPHVPPADLQVFWKLATQCGKVGGKKRQISSLTHWNCSGCFHWSYNIGINQEDVCKSYDSKTNKNQTIDLIFLIPSTYKARAQRDAIRRTWASVTRNNTSNFRHVFFFGASKNPKRMRQLVEESRQFRDVVVNSGFDDTYRNLTFKTLTLLRWFAETCPRARYFLKVDDDMWINSRVLLTSLGRVEDQLQTTIAGNCPKPRNVIRNMGDKWGVSYSEYPADKYPAYCSGMAYAGTVGVAKLLVAVSRDVPYFPLEDVYVGLCLKQLGYEPKDLVEFQFLTPKFFRRDPCMVWSNNVTTLHGAWPSDLQRYWNLATQCGKLEELLPRIEEAKIEF